MHYCSSLLSPLHYFIFDFPILKDDVNIYTILIYERDTTALTLFSDILFYNFIS